MIPTTIRRRDDKLETREKVFFLINSPISKIKIDPLRSINSGKNSKSKKLFCICNLIIINNAFYWQSHRI